MMVMQISPSGTHQATIEAPVLSWLNPTAGESLVMCGTVPGQPHS